MTSTVTERQEVNVSILQFVIKITPLWKITCIRDHTVLSVTQHP